jgi:hypothetical protein
VVERSDDKADIATESGRLDAGDSAPLAGPRLRLVPRLGVIATTALSAIARVVRTASAVSSTFLD